MASVSAAGESPDGAPETPEVTPAMIAAGCGAIADYDTDLIEISRGDGRRHVGGIYAAMHAVSGRNGRS